jgi:hypothetical protein
MAEFSTTLPAPPKSRAAFSRDDVPDAKRGYPDFDLREFASRRGLEWLDHTTPAGYRAAVPGKEELQSNTLRGELAGGAYGVLAHEGLEVGYSGDSFDWGGTFYSIRVRTTGVGLRGMLPFSGRANEALVRIPCTVAGVRLSESVGSQLCLRIDTRRSAPPVSFGHRIKLDELIGIDGWSVWGLPKVEPDALASLVREPVAELIRAHAEDGLFQVVVWWGTLLVRRNGFLRDDEPLDELGRAASTLAARVREICLQRAEPRPFASELAPPLFRDWQDPQVIFNPSDTWHAWAEDTARRYGFTREDPLAYHRAFPSLPVPGQASVVMRGTLASVGDCRLVVHREREASRAALLIAPPAGLSPTPPGGVASNTRGVRLESGGGLLAVWATSSYWGNAMVGDIDAFVSVAEATIEETLAAAR